MRPAALLLTLTVSLGGLAQSIRPLQFQSDTLEQIAIADRRVSLNEIRRRGMEVFSTPFTAAIGYGDGPAQTFDPLYPTAPGHRPTLQNNGKFLRVNGLDAQTCIECHSVVSNLTVPFTFGVGGVGGSNSNALVKPTLIDVADPQRNGFAAFSGRFINPPFLFGSGGIELAAKEMTADLQALRKQALAQPGVPVALVTKGVSFGSIVVRDGVLDASGVQGVDADLVVRPFGRKGEFATVRAFDVDAMQFHFGMQPMEVVGRAIDADGDGVANEISEGDLSALSIFLTNLERPRANGSESARNGEARFQSLGCAGCHVPVLHTNSPILTYSLPEVDTDPSANVYYQVDLRDRNPGFDASPEGGILVPSFSDLKRHDMGPRLAESAGSRLDTRFITARLWGVADTAPYLHDGRAHTLEEAILMHGGEGQTACDAFATLSEQERQELISFLMTLRTPAQPAGDLFLPRGRSIVR